MADRNAFSATDILVSVALELPIVRVESWWAGASQLRHTTDTIFLNIPLFICAGAVIYLFMIIMVVDEMTHSLHPCTSHSGGADHMSRK